MFCAGGTSSGFSRANGAFAVLELRTRPKSVAGPLAPITMADLSSSSTTYWVARRKAEVLAAIDSGLPGIGDACQRSRLSEGELDGWRRSPRSAGTPGPPHPYRRPYRTRKDLQTVQR